ncbi:alanine dehydrogenase [Methanocella sp. CWC-04]|uniref:Alanine dehydrogenase n=1 Tax=Methanooceanicella nereidis TaxID=2052831 RepID=A0AAP2RBR3_9EURY|nr:alanine dehydrogenase [Methanocella sp. CWC-04]MCD1294309.1 alanine dehydrogenase [Methanocella sp. CWC-04]
MARLLSMEDVKRTITMDDVLPAVEEVFKEYALGKTYMPSKIYLDIPGYGDFRAMPSYVPSINTAGLKWVNVHPENPRKGIPTVMGTIMLSKPETGEILSIMDGTYVTDMRTGAAGGVAAKYLARKDTSVIGLVGSGEQAWTQMLAYKCVFGDRIKLVKVYSRTLSHAEKFAKRVQDKMGYNAKAFEKCEDAVDADLVATVTPARSPVVMSGWIKPGTHINAIGADAPGKQELETELTLRSRIFVDSYDQTSHSGEINIPWGQGLLNEKMLAGSIGEVIAGIKPGRTDDEEITIFDSTGLAIQDMATAHIVYEKSMKGNMGTEFNF